MILEATKADPNLIQSQDVKATNDWTASRNSILGAKEFNVEGDIVNPNQSPFSSPRSAKGLINAQKAKDEKVAREAAREA